MICGRCKLAFDPSKRTTKHRHRRRTPDDVPFGVEWKPHELRLRTDNAWGVALMFILMAGGLVVGGLADEQMRFLVFVSIPLWLLALPFTAPITVRVDAQSVTRRVWPLWARRVARDDVAGFQIHHVRYRGTEAWQVHVVRRSKPQRTVGLCGLHTKDDADTFEQMLHEAARAFPSPAA
jgi:hypothetical protein